MGLTSSLFSSLTGLNANSQLLSVSGNNIANANTLGFKGSRVTFESSILQNLSPSSAPNDESGGTNAAQVGLGVRTGSITRNFNNGSLQPTGINSDIAIEGAGFFIVKAADEQFFTRAGSFKLDRDFNLVDPNGNFLQGYGVDNEFGVVQGVLESVNIPIGTLTLAESTETVEISGNLNAEGELSTRGTILQSVPLYSSNAVAPPPGGTEATAATPLASLYTYDSGTATYSQVFNTGDVVTLTEATRGGATIPNKTFQVGPANTTGSDDFGTTLQDYMEFFQHVLGIDTSVSGGVSIDAAGQMVIEGNQGTIHDLNIDQANIVVNLGVSPSLPLDWTRTQRSDGESVRTTFVAYDSLGTEMNVDLTVVLENRDDNGTYWRFYVQSEDDTDLDRVLSNGTLEFDNNGRLVNVTDNLFSIDRAGTGALNPQSISLEFNNDGGSLSALTDITSQVQMLKQDGAGIGTLEDFSVGEDGVITGIFSNSLLRTLGQVVIANFANPQGLVEVAANNFAVSTNSGNAQIVVPGSAGTGRIIGGALELSNVELADEFVNLISASTGFSASSRVLTTSDQLIQELLAAVR